jgi:type II secretory pathway pseudopilin PulG
MRSFFESPSAGRAIQGEKAYSLTELVVIIAVVGILAAIGIGMVTGTVESSKYNMATANLEILNGAVRKYVHAVKELTNAPTDGIGDETAVFAELKIDGTTEERPGSPYLQTDLKIRSSSDPDTYRAAWNGYEFKLIGLGTNGTGIDLLELQ